MTIVVDASVVVAALVDEGFVGAWARTGFAAEDLAAPTHLFVEASSTLRRQVMSQAIPREVAAMAHRELIDLSVELFPFELLAERVWELHSTVTAYDAAYVALAEALDAPLWTLDRRLSRASGPRCTFRTPDAQ